jgi:hypothetical protein
LMAKRLGEHIVWATDSPFIAQSSGSRAFK